MKRSIYVLALISLLAFACSDQEKDKNSTSNSESSNQETNDAQDEMSRMITLPTPMQIPALLRNNRAPYRKTNLLPIVGAEKSYYSSAVLMGMYMIDLGYTSAFNDHQTAKAYMAKCADLSGELGLGMKVSRSYITRFEDNTNKPDSLGYIVLDLYNKGHKYFMDQGKDGLGLIMVMGCYMEGLHLIFTEARGHDLILFLHLINQQKMYLDNLLYATEKYEIPTELSEEYGIILRINELMKATDFPSVYQLKTGQKNVSHINEDNLKEIELLTAKFRESILI